MIGFKKIAFFQGKQLLNIETIILTVISKMEVLNVM